MLRKIREDIALLTRFYRSRNTCSKLILVINGTRNVHHPRRRCIPLIDEGYTMTAQLNHRLYRCDGFGPARRSGRNFHFFTGYNVSLPLR